MLTIIMVHSRAVRTKDLLAETGLLPAEASPRRHLFDRVRAVLVELFPQARSLPGRLPRSLIAFLYVLSVAAGTLLMLVRYVGTPPWESVYAEDFPVYLVPALAHPWHSMFDSYAGYWQLTLRIIGQGVSLLPIGDAAAGFAVSGA